MGKIAFGFIIAGDTFQMGLIIVDLNVLIKFQSCALS